MLPEVIVPGDILGNTLVLNAVVGDGFPSLHEFVDGFRMIGDGHSLIVTRVGVPYFFDIGSGN